ncbi:uncharacterized protein EV154DRAFT_580069 [Mucor mucedo]|uniref:uncharacterized protein n=1 Tax=Mucor mucedo TaxID=29922 RepID=UPI0022211002|nr:uncharacterized protein EV154DRAFT_580069 [Mucor mucedo]KAI7872237.1 hypothetical protein EV154DRAFT_580069 [Mucor mucedo]
MYRINNCPSFTGLYTVTNEYDEIRIMVLTPTKALDFLKGPFEKMLGSLRENNHQEPTVYFTDNVDADRSFLESVLPSLKENVRRIEDHSSVVERSSSLPRLAFVCHCSLLRCMRSREAFLVGLKELLASENIVKIGRSVEADLERMHKDYGVSYNGFLELHRLCYDVGLLISIGKDSSLAALTGMVLGRTLPKGDVRTSNWDAITLSAEQIKYAALDAWVSLEIFKEINHLPRVNQKVTPLDTGVPNHIAYTSTCSGSPCTYGFVVDQEDNNHFFLRSHQFDSHANSDIIVRRKCIVVQVTSVVKRNMIAKCHNSRRLPNAEKKCLGDLETATSVDRGNDSQFYLVVEVSNLITTASVDILKKYFLSPCSRADPLIPPISQNNDDAPAPSSHAMSTIPELPSRVLKDIFHLMDMIPESKFHSCSKEFKRLFRDALFVVNEEDKVRVSHVLETKLQTTFEETLLCHSSWLLKRVRRVVPPPHELYPVMKTLFDECSRWYDPRKNLPLFDDLCKKKCEAVLRKIEAGHVSDPVGVPLYRHIKTDKYGLNIYRCLRGTSSVEGGVHRNIIRKFGFFNSSPELANCALSEYRLRHNIEVGCRNRFGVEHIGHHNPWLTQNINKLKMQLGHRFKGTYHNHDGTTLSFKDGYETFGVCQIPLDWANTYRMEPGTRINSQNVYTRIAEQVAVLPCVNINKTEQSVYEYLALLQNVALAVVPVNTMEEKKLFKTILERNPQYNGKEPNWEDFCIIWSGFCNSQENNNSGKNLFYKTPYHLKSYYGRNIEYKTERVSIEVINATSMEIVENAIIPSNRPQVQHLEPTNFLLFSNTYTDIAPRTISPTQISTSTRNSQSPQRIHPAIRSLDLHTSRASFLVTIVIQLLVKAVKILHIAIYS